MHNGLCSHIYPDWIVVPHRTEDIAFVVQLTNKHNIPISVRSGGHSYTCTNIRQGGVHFDMREMNHVGLVNNHMAVLGPGGTWGDVLEKIPPTKFTMLHGQCLRDQSFTSLKVDLRQEISHLCNRGFAFIRYLIGTSP